MKAIKLRTKIEAAMAIIFVIILAVAGVASITRIISDSSDNSYTFIRNSNGNFWEPLGSNIQLAIDDLNDGGSVWVGSDVELSSPIEPKDHVIIDFEEHEVTFSSDISFVIMQSCQYATVRNARLKLTSEHSASIIKLYIASGSGWADRVRYNTVEDIYIENTGTWTPGVGWTDHNYVGIHLQNDGGSNFLFNTFRNIVMEGAGIGIYLEHSTSSGYGNGNYFENIYIDQFETMILFDVDASANFGFNQNVFTNIKGQSATFSNYGVKDISFNGNHFDHCLVWDWNVAAGTNDWIIESRASRTYICAHRFINVLNEGSDTTMVAG